MRRAEKNRKTNPIEIVFATPVRKNKANQTQFFGFVAWALVPAASTIVSTRWGGAEGSATVRGNSFAGGAKSARKSCGSAKSAKSALQARWKRDTKAADLQKTLDPRYGKRSPLWERSALRGRHKAADLQKTLDPRYGKDPRYGGDTKAADLQKALDPRFELLRATGATQKPRMESRSLSPTPPLSPTFLVADFPLFPTLPLPVSPTFPVIRNVGRPAGRSCSHAGRECRRR
jgi:hypothetical protein